MRFAVLLAFAALLGSPAVAEPRRELIFIRVTVGDLDLTTQDGAAKMFRRLKGAARAVCQLPPSALFPGSEGREWRCRRDALETAVERLKAPRLTLAFSEWLSAEPEPRAPSP